ncbi:hypothetical protein BHM03_00023237 [Ensete ventricosum]|nr:hypothetical protein BHM03_00023237 [Ensete ventricosum]
MSGEILGMLKAGTWASQRKCWEKHSSGDQHPSQRRFSGMRLLLKVQVAKLTDRANFHDCEGRTVIVMRPTKQNTASHDNQLRQLVYLLENAAEHQEQMMWLLDFNGWSFVNSVLVKTVPETANILRSHYPERLAFGFLYNPPRILETFWKAIEHFLDPNTLQKGEIRV